MSDDCKSLLTALVTVRLHALHEKEATCFRRLRLESDGREGCDRFPPFAFGVRWTRRRRHVSAVCMWIQMDEEDPEKAAAVCRVEADGHGHTNQPPPLIGKRSVI